MAGNPLIPECPDYRTLRLATTRHKSKHPIKVPEIRGSYIALDWIIFGSGVDLALHADQGRISRNGRKSIDVKCPEFRTLRLATPIHKRKHPVIVSESQGLYIDSDWITFGSGVDLALHANPGPSS